MCALCYNVTVVGAAQYACAGRFFIALAYGVD